MLSAFSVPFLGTRVMRVYCFWNLTNSRWFLVSSIEARNFEMRSSLTILRMSVSLYRIFYPCWKMRSCLDFLRF